MEGVRADPRTVSVAWDPACKNCAVESATVPRWLAFHSWNLSPPLGDLMAAARLWLCLVNSPLSL